MLDQKNSMPYCLLLWICLSTSFNLNAQDFPQKWVGKWEGHMQVFTPDTTILVPTSLIVRPTDNDNIWDWIVSYGEGESKQERPYQLICIHAAHGRYDIDEKNSIKLSCLYSQESLVSMFEVEGSCIVSSYRLEGEILVFENISASMKQVRESGGEDNIPKVKDFPLTGLQRARLRKVSID